MLPAPESEPDQAPRTTLLHFPSNDQEKSPHMTTRTRPRRAPDRGSPLEGIVTAALEDMKAVNVKIMDVRGLTDIADVMVICSGNSDRHVKSIADRVIEKAKEGGFRPLGVEGAARRRVGAGRPARRRAARNAAASARVLQPRAHVGVRTPAPPSKPFPQSVACPAGTRGRRPRRRRSARPRRLHDPGARAPSNRRHFLRKAAALVRIRVIAIGSRMPGWVREAVDDYLRRFASQLRVSIIEIEAGNRTGSNPEARDRSRGRAAARRRSPGRVRRRARRARQRDDHETARDLARRAHARRSRRGAAHRWAGWLRARACSRGPTTSGRSRSSPSRMPWCGSCSRSSSIAPIAC